jgi:hypothetical protein
MAWDRKSVSVSQRLLLDRGPDAVILKSRSCVFLPSVIRRPVLYDVDGLLLSANQLPGATVGPTGRLSREVLTFLELSVQMDTGIFILYLQSLSST